MQKQQLIKLIVVDIYFYYSVYKNWSINNNNKDKNSYNNYI